MECISDSCFLNDDQGSAQRETLAAELGSVCQVSSSRSVPAVETLAPSLPHPLSRCFLKTTGISSTWQAACCGPFVDLGGGQASWPFLSVLPETLCVRGVRCLVS